VGVFYPIVLDLPSYTGYYMLETPGISRELKKIGKVYQ
jgi:hypothetical protein